MKVEDYFISAAFSNSQNYMIGHSWSRTLQCRIEKYCETVTAQQTIIQKHPSHVISLINSFKPIYKKWQE